MAEKATKVPSRPHEVPRSTSVTEKSCSEPGGGVAYKNLNVYGYTKSTDYQKTFSNYPSAIWSEISTAVFGRTNKTKKCILQDFEGILHGGELLLVLGRPGSGCTTLLKTLAGDTYGLDVDRSSWLNYQGISPAEDSQRLRGERTYSAESDVHFPHLSVAQTLGFVAQATLASTNQGKAQRKSMALNSVTEVLKSMGLEHTVDTKVGNSSIKGISGGERKRTSIAEVLLANSSLQCWDNSTRGLDSANALQFVRTLRLKAEETGCASMATLYQASEDIYNSFDKVTLLYEGREIYFGPVNAAKAYFENLGFVCPQRSTTADFLCSITDPRGRKAQEDRQNTVPRNADDFVSAWSESPERRRLLDSIQDYEQKYPLRSNSSPGRKYFTGSKRTNPYKVSFLEQIRLCLIRGFQRLFRDLPPAISAIGGNAIVSIILGSMFYNMPDDTSSFFGRGVLLFFTILTNTSLSSFEGVQLWDHRPIVEKQYQLAFYRRSAEAVASMLCDLPNKIFLTIGFNIPFYFLANMRRTPGAFFTFYLFALMSFVTGSMLYRTIGAMSRTLTASIAPGSVFILLLVIYTGFVLPIPSMHPWLRWFGYLNPIAYAFESLMINEFDGREFPCASFLPSGPDYANVGPEQRMCTVTGAAQGSNVVSGRQYLETTFDYYPSHLWRNLGILFALMIFLCSLYLFATEYMSAQPSRGEVLVFQKGHSARTRRHHDEEAGMSEKTAQVGDSSAEGVEVGCQGQMKESINAATFVWDDLSYEIKTKEGTRKLLDGVEGWVEPGSLTALMGASGAGKTTLLNVLANRATTGVIGGEKVVDSKFQNEAFARKVGYAQQEDVAVRTATVREALIFSARLRQPPQYSDAEKLSYVDEVISQLDLTDFVDAVIGVPGEGLNIEQRKRVTIGIELAARPELLLFLDEPTSGLDSDTASSICHLLRQLANSGHAILCTIHQPSGTIFEQFDRLLFINDGRSIYFGDIGPNSATILNYFLRNGAAECPPSANPAEYLMDLTAKSKPRDAKEDWAETWASSSERRQVKDAVQTIKQKLQAPPTELARNVSRSKYAATYVQQMYHLTMRNFQQDWRTPSYLYSKFFFTLGSGLVNGFSFYMSATSLQGIQNQIFSVFLVFVIHTSLVQLIMPRFLESRFQYEFIERPSRTYSWVIFVMANVISELPSQLVLAVIEFVLWYYPLGMWKNALATDSLNQRGGFMFLMTWSYFIFSSTFSQMMVTIMPDAATGINIAALFYSLALLFCGVLVTPSALPRFWIFMYRATPITYFVDAMVSAGIGGVRVVCSAKELVRIEPPDGQTCASYLRAYLSEAGGQLLNPEAMRTCEVCPVSTTDDVISAIGASYGERWRNFGITLAYSAINVLGALLLYWLFRVPKGVRQAKS